MLEILPSASELRMAAAEAAEGETRRANTDDD